MDELYPATLLRESSLYAGPIARKAFSGNRCCQTYGKCIPFMNEQKDVTPDITWTFRALLKGIQSDPPSTGQRRGCFTLASIQFGFIYLYASGFAPCIWRQTQPSALCTPEQRRAEPPIPPDPTALFPGGQSIVVSLKMANQSQGLENHQLQPAWQHTKHAEHCE